MSDFQKLLDQALERVNLTPVDDTPEVEDYNIVNTVYKLRPKRAFKLAQNSFFLLFKGHLLALFGKSGIRASEIQKLPVLSPSRRWIRDLQDSKNIFLVRILIYEVLTSKTLYKVKIYIFLYLMH